MLMVWGVLFVFCLCGGEILFVLKLPRNTKIVLRIGQQKGPLWSCDTTWPWSSWCVVAVSLKPTILQHNLKGISICFQITWFHSFTVNMRLC